MFDARLVHLTDDKKGLIFGSLGSPVVISIIAELPCFRIAFLLPSMSLMASLIKSWVIVTEGGMNDFGISIISDGNFYESAVSLICRLELL